MIKNKLVQSSSYLDKFIKSQKNLSKTPPRLFPDDLKNPLQVPTIPPNPIKDAPVPTLDLSHHLLQKLEQSCTNLNHFNQIHTQLVLLGLFQHPLAAGRYIKKLCTCLNSISRCVTLYQRIEEPDAFMCNTIMKAFVNANDPFGALNFYYGRMIVRWVLPNHYTFPLVAKICADIGCLSEGQKAHARAVRFGFDVDLFVRNSLIHMYSVCGRVSDARDVFDNGFVLDSVSWNSMIDGYVKNGEVGLARELFDEMYEKDVFSWNSMIVGYVGVGDMETAEALFETMPPRARDVVSWNSMIDGYARTRNVGMARGLFDRMPFRNLVSWNIMLALYLRCKDYGECLRLFDRMIEEGEARPNEASLVSVLSACANFGRLDRGKWVHSYIKDNGIKPDVLLSTALLTMYAKCGVMDLAKYIFDKMPKTSVVSWNAMIMGYGVQGQGDKALEMFLEMDNRGPVPNLATFVCILSACSRAGMVLEGWWLFDLMYHKYKIEPKVEHYGCMVHLLGLAGLMEEPEEIMKKMNTEAEPTLWGVLLSACNSQSRPELGEIVAKRLIKLNPKDVGAYVLLSNLYATEWKWDDVEHVRKKIKEVRFGKTADSSTVHAGEFGSASYLETDAPHRRSMMYSLLSEIGLQLKLSYADSCGVLEVAKLR